MKSKTSVIFPTYNRDKDLNQAIKSVLKNTLLPLEIIIIDQSENNKTKNLYEKFKKNFPKIKFKYFYLKIKSSAQARNIGASLSEGEFLLFLDDDVEIDEKYIETGQLFFEKNKKIMGITGKDLLANNNLKKKIITFSKRIIGFIFCMDSFFQKNKVLKSGKNSLHNTSFKESNAQWLNGCNMFYRKDIFKKDNLSFNPDFIRWSFGEDAMLGYQVYKKYPNSLKYIPSLKIKHHHSQEKSLTNSEFIKMQIIYRYVFWKKEIYNNNFLNLLCYLWSQLSIIPYIILTNKNKLKTIKLIFKSYYFIFSKMRNNMNPIEYNNFILDK